LIERNISMKKMLLVMLLPLFVAAPALAEPVSFSAAGDKYTYDTAIKGDVTLIRGTNLSTGEKFSLRVRNDLVTGYYDGSPVSFRQKAGTSTKLASR
jgi:hypothetical protein